MFPLNFTLVFNNYKYDHMHISIKYSLGIVFKSHHVCIGELSGNVQKFSCNWNSPPLDGACLVFLSRLYVKITHKLGYHSQPDRGWGGGWRGVGGAGVEGGDRTFEQIYHNEAHVGDLSKTDVRSFSPGSPRQKYFRHCRP